MPSLRWAVCMWKHSPELEGWAMVGEVAFSHAHCLEGDPFLLEALACQASRNRDRNELSPRWGLLANPWCVVCSQPETRLSYDDLAHLPATHLPQWKPVAFLSQGHSAEPVQSFQKIKPRNYSYSPTQQRLTKHTHVEASSSISTLCITKYLLTSICLGAFRFCV